MNKRGIVLGLILLNLVQIAIFYPAISEFFTGDGLFYLARTPKGWNDLVTIFTRLDDASNYRPLTFVLTLALKALFHLNPAPYHIFMISAHIGMTWLVFWMARLLFDSDIGALMVAWLFGVHSSAARVAFGLAFLADFLFAAFYVVAIAAFIKSEKERSRNWRLLSIGAFVLSLLSKEPAVTFPAVISLSLILVPCVSLNFRAMGFKYILRRTLPFWVLSVIYLCFFAYRTGGRFTPQDPQHPYYVEYSWNNLVSKQQYLRWAFNLPRYNTMGGHPSVMGAARRRLGQKRAGAFGNISDFWLYLIGPIWMFWLAVHGDWEHLREFWMGSLLAPAMFIVFMALVHDFLKRRNDADRTIWFGLAMFAIPMLPVMPLPASKTMLHHLYLSSAGLAVAVAQFWRVNSAIKGRHRVLTAVVPALLLVSGIEYSLRYPNMGWPTVTARLTRSYLSDVQKLFPKLPRGAVLRFDTGTPDLMFLTASGDLFRLYYEDPTLITEFPGNNRRPWSDRDVLHLRERAGRIEFLKGVTKP